MADQAAGLRRLISRDFVRILALTAAHRGAGVSFLAPQLAEALRAQGREVCLLQADGAPLPGAVSLLPMLTAAEGDEHRLATALERARAGAEIALLDLSCAYPQRQVPISACVPDVVLLLEAHQSRLRDSYALIKRISSVSGKCRLHILFNRCDDTERARRIFGSLSTTSDRFLSRPLEFLGALPLVERPPPTGDVDEEFARLHPHSPWSRMLRALAERILLWPFPGENDMSGFARRLVAALPARSEY